MVRFIRLPILELIGRADPQGLGMPLASSADGTKLVAAAYGGFHLYFYDSGSSCSNRIRTKLECRASSADGTKLVATVSGGLYLYFYGFWS